MKVRQVVNAVLIPLGAISVAFLAGTAVAAWLLVRPGKRSDYDCIPRIRYGRLEPLELRTEDGVRLHAWVLASQSADPRRWVVLLHGYRSDRDIHHGRARFFSRRGYNVLMLHFRGHGSSDRARISYGFHERKDVKAAFDFIARLCSGMEAVIGVDGVSMGAAAAAYAVARSGVRPAWLILESCYDNIRHALANRLSIRFGQSLTPWVAWPVGFIVEHLVQLRAEDLDPAKALEHNACPVLVMAGDSERVLKMVEIEYLYGSLPEPKLLVLFPGAGHEDLLAYDPRRYTRAVTEFLKQYDPHLVKGEASAAGAGVPVGTPLQALPSGRYPIEAADIPKPAHASRLP